MLAESLRLILITGMVGVSSIWAAQASSGSQVITNNTPKFGANALDLGQVNPATMVDVTVWLKVHNQSQLDSLAESLYDPASPNYRHWLTNNQFLTQFAPTATEVKTLQSFLASQNLSLVNVGPDNFYVTARGTAATVQSAFKISLHQFQVNGQTIRANTSDPVITGPAAALVSAVYGLDTLQFTHPMMKAGIPSSSAPGGGGFQSAATSAATAAASPLFDSTCFTGTTTESYTTGGALPDATFKGNGYTKSIQGCGYTPAEIRKAYNLNSLYKKGLDGSGQTIVIIDWCGSPTIRSDANAFSAQYGLPPLTPANFLITNYPGPSYCASPDAEINLDVEWAHAIAPGASINLVVPPSASFTDVDNAVLYAAVNQLGSVISGSYGSIESFTPSTILVTENLISETAAVLGESANFSSGDGGDFTADGIPATVLAPADSPYSTAVGGVSLALNSDSSIKFQTGWGTNQNPLIESDFISDPPSTSGYFYGGSGGGPSAVFAKPRYQSKLRGTFRQLPDISWLADPFTGGIIAITEPGVSPSLVYEAIGGTSLACPMFSALWAIANQASGYPLGQAARYVYSLPAGTITDIVPYGSSTNVTAKITDTIGTTTYSAAAIAAPLENTTTFYSVLWDYPLYQDTTFLITFGTDSGLTVTTGWDNVTGVGVPNGSAFVNAFASWAP